MTDAADDDERRYPGGKRRAFAYHRPGLDGVTEPVLQRAFEYWRNVDVDLGERVEKGVRAGSLVQGAAG